MLVTLPEIVTMVTPVPVKIEFSPFPRPVTSRPLMLVGMDTTVLVPVYSVIVMVFVAPEFTV
jgi:hypothetical protein